MYIFQNAVLRQRGKNETWKEVNVSGLQMSLLFSRYFDGHIELTNSAVGPGSFFVDLNALRRVDYSFYNLILQDWLGTLGTNLLPHLAQEPTYTTKSVLYSDGFQGNFKVRKEDLNLVVGKDNVDIDHLQHYTLTTVNGFLHRTSPLGEEELLVHGGGNTSKYLPTNHLGMMSFVDIGQIQQISITPSMVKRTQDRFPLLKGCTINLNTNLENKSVMISVGGYLHVEDSLLDVVSVSEGLIRVNLERVDWIKRFFEMRRFLNVDSLNISTSPTKPGSVVVNEFSTDDFVLALLQLPQTFVIIVDTPMLHYRVKPVSNQGLPGVYELPTEPLYPMKNVTGRFIDYWYRNEYGRWVMDTDVLLLKEYVYETTPWQMDRIVSEATQKELTGFATTSLFQLSTTIRS